MYVMAKYAVSVSALQIPTGGAAGSRDVGVSCVTAFDY